MNQQRILTPRCVETSKLTQVDTDEFETVIIETWFLEGLFAENNSGLTSGVWERLVPQLIPLVKQNRMLGRVNLSPETEGTRSLQLKDITHIVRDLKIVPAGVWGSLELIHCPQGEDVITLLKNNVKFKANWVGYGCREMDVFGIIKEVTNFKVIRFDLSVVAKKDLDKK